MVCEWTRSYIYQPNTPKNKQCDYDVICDAIIEYVEKFSDKHNMKIITTTDDHTWYKHGKPVEITCYHLQSGSKITPIEEVTANVVACYESALEDESTNFGENGVYIGEPWSTEDLEVFTWECMIEFWS